ncbi:ABC transporter substrate-binding protein [Hypericibacter adhaerens]|uniref:ABC transporter substrate-binding protein n=1 Tax=Hypericibacter adhaerens TaxID=2602016 RepID=A0A5J6MU80_9PROT|nr:ABC transporter substrate-binding protein [Hypericibacter adhaerens]QEX20773.1 ABC transporter substrate-binding protein [Hypericibacter adhaerens]
MPVTVDKLKLLSLPAAILAASFLCVSSGIAAEVAPPQRYVDSGRIVFCSDFSYPPWVYVDPQTTKYVGVEVDFSDALAALMGVKAEHKNIQFDGLIPAIQAGQCDAIISTLIDKPARREVLDFVDYALVGNVVIVPFASDIFVQDLTGLSGKKVVVQTGSQLEQDLVSASDKLKGDGKPGITVVAIPNNTDAMQQLFAGLVDAYYAVPEQASYLNSQRPNSVKLGSPTLGARPVGIATAKKDHDLYEAIAAAFKVYQANGGYDALFTKAGLQSLEVPH